MNAKGTILYKYQAEYLFKSVRLIEKMLWFLTLDQQTEVKDKLENERNELLRVMNEAGWDMTKEKKLVKIERS